MRGERGRHRWGFVAVRHGAYLDANLTGPPTFLEVDETLRQKDWAPTAGIPDPCYRLKKAMYGLKDSPRLWYDAINREFERRLAHSPLKAHCVIREKVKLLGQGNECNIGCLWVMFGPANGA